MWEEKDVPGSDVKMRWSYFNLHCATFLLQLVIKFQNKKVNLKLTNPTQSYPSTSQCIQVMFLDKQFYSGPLLPTPTVGNSPITASPENDISITVATATTNEKLQSAGLTNVKLL